MASFCSVGFLLLASFPCFALLCPWPLVLLLAFLHYFRLLRPLSLSLSSSHVSSLRSLGSPPVTSWPSVISLAFAPLWVLAREVLFLVSRVSASRVWGFRVVSLVFSFRAPLLPFLLSRGLLRCRGPLYALCLAPFCRVLVALSVICVQCSFFLLSRFPGYLARPSSVSPRRRSLFLSPRGPFRSLSKPFFALPRGIFSYPASSSSSTLSSSSVPSRRGLLVCLQLRLHRRLRVLLPCPLLWLLPLRLPSGFHLLLSFCWAVLFLEWFRWGPVVPARVVV